MPLLALSVLLSLTATLLLTGAAQAQTVPDPPNLTATPGNASIALTWSVADNGAAITQYRAHWRVAGGTGDGTRFNLPTTDQSYTIEGLVNGEQYEVRLRARNSVGWGDWSGWVTVRMPGYCLLVPDAAWCALPEPTFEISADYTDGPNAKPVVTVTVPMPFLEQDPNALVVVYNINYQHETDAWSVTISPGADPTATLPALAGGWTPRDYQVLLQVSGTRSNGDPFNVSGEWVTWTLQTYCGLNSNAASCRPADSGNNNAGGSAPVFVYIPPPPTAAEIDLSLSSATTLLREVVTATISLRTNTGAAIDDTVTIDVSGDLELHVLDVDLEGGVESENGEVTIRFEVIGGSGSATITATVGDGGDLITASAELTLEADLDCLAAREWKLDTFMVWTCEGEIGAVELYEALSEHDVSALLYWDAESGWQRYALLVDGRPLPGSAEFQLSQYSLVWLSS